MFFPSHHPIPGKRSKGASLKFYFDKNFKSTLSKIATQQKEIPSFSPLGSYKLRNQEKKLCLHCFELVGAIKQFHWNISELQFYK